MVASYSVTEREGCRIVYGHLPMSAFLALSSDMSDAAVIDSHVARLLDASLAIGDPEQLAKLREDPEVLRAARERVAGEVRGLSSAAAEWYAIGERGRSADAMFFRFTGCGSACEDAPEDLGAFRRCRLLIEQAPEFGELIPKMKDVSATWSRLADHWADLCAEMDREAPDWREGAFSAAKTYKALKAVLSEQVAVTSGAEK